MFGWLWRFISFVSLLLLAATIIVWVHTANDQYGITACTLWPRTAGGMIAEDAVIFGRGEICIDGKTERFPDRESYDAALANFEATGPAGWLRYYPVDSQFWNSWATAPGTLIRHVLPGLSTGNLAGAVSISPSPVWTIQFGFARAVLVFVALPGVSLIMVVWKIMRRPPPGVCSMCGYDLRATPGRCPECGIVTSSSRDKVKGTWRLLLVRLSPSLAAVFAGLILLLSVLGLLHYQDKLWQRALADGMLAEAVSVDNVEEAARAIEYGADARRVRAGLQRNDFGSPLLLRAAARGCHVEMMELLIRHGAPVDAVNINGETALHFCAGNKQAIYLIDHGADVNATDTRGRTPLHDAAATGNLAVAKALINRGAKINAHDVFEQTPLDDVGREGMREMRMLLLLHGGHE